MQSTLLFHSSARTAAATSVTMLFSENTDFPFVVYFTGLLTASGWEEDSEPLLDTVDGLGATIQKKM